MARQVTTILMPHASSHLREASLHKRVAYLRGLLRNNVALLRSKPEALVEEAERECDRLIAVMSRARRAVGHREPEVLKGLRVLEIGYGQRCLTGLVLHSLGVAYTGIDLEVASFRITPGIAWRMLSTNGAYRLTKALVRHVGFDRPLFKAYDVALRRRGAQLIGSGVDVRVGSAEEIAGWLESFDVVYSFDVFEHLRPTALRATVPAMLNRLSDRGCCVIRVNPFPGILGGHSVEWSGASLTDDRPRRTPPWEHLRQPEAATGDTYLNRLSHAD